MGKNTYHISCEFGGVDPIPVYAHIRIDARAQSQLRKYSRKAKKS
jgi:hypothetical protein